MKYNRKVKETKMKTMILKRGYTLQVLAERIEEQNPGYVIGLDRLSRISNTGKGLNIHLQLLVKIAKALQCSLDHLVDDM